MGLLRFLQRDLFSRPKVSFPLGEPLTTPWATDRTNLVLRKFAQQPNGTVIEDARRARLFISRFWLHAPIDQLERLYQGPIGETYRLLLSTPLPNIPLAQIELDWRQRLVSQLEGGFQRTDAINLLLASMPFFGHSKMKVQNALENVPRWLLQDYATWFEPGLLMMVETRSSLPFVSDVSNPVLPAELEERRVPSTSLELMPNQNLPRISPLDSDAMLLIQDQQFLDQILTFANLFSIDPQDERVLMKLRALRPQLGQIWLDIPPSQIKKVFHSGFGERYRNLLRCGFVGLPLQPQELEARNLLAGYLSDLSRSGTINALLAVLLYYPAQRIKFQGQELSLPSWLLAELNALTRMPTASQR